MTMLINCLQIILCFSILMSAILYGILCILRIEAKVKDHSERDEEREEI